MLDCAIIGGGPAGSTLAYSLRKSDLKIGILDKQKFPRPKVCAGWVTPEVMRTLNIDLEDYVKNNTLQKISGFKIEEVLVDNLLSLFRKHPKYTCQKEPISTRQFWKRNFLKC